MFRQIPVRTHTHTHTHYPGLFSGVDKRNTCTYLKTYQVMLYPYPPTWSNFVKVRSPGWRGNVFLFFQISARSACQICLRWIPTRVAGWPFVRQQSCYKSQITNDTSPWQTCGRLRPSGSVIKNNQDSVRGQHYLLSRLKKNTLPWKPDKVLAGVAIQSAYNNQIQ